MTDTAGHHVQETLLLRVFIAVLLLGTIAFAFLWFSDARRMALTKAHDSAALSELSEFHLKFLGQRSIHTEEYIKELNAFVDPRAEDYRLLDAYRRKVQSVKSAKLNDQQKR